MQLILLNSSFHGTLSRSHIVLCGDTIPWMAIGDQRKNSVLARIVFDPQNKELSFQRTKDRWWTAYWQANVDGFILSGILNRHDQCCYLASLPKSLTLALFSPEFGFASNALRRFLLCGGQNNDPWAGGIAVARYNRTTGHELN